MEIFMIKYLFTMALPIFSLPSAPIDSERIPQPYTQQWTSFYKETIVSALLFNMAVEYMVDFGKYVVNIKCRKFKRTDKYPYESRYASLLYFLFTCFSYGFAMPFLIVITFFIICAIFMMDKFLLRYFFIPE